MAYDPSQIRCWDNKYKALETHEMAKSKLDFLFSHLLYTFLFSSCCLRFVHPILQGISIILLFCFNPL